LAVAGDGSEKSSQVLPQINFRRSVPAAKVSDFLPSLVLISSMHSLVTATS
jgi:hypothetical protein